MQRAAADIDRLDLGQVGALDCLVIALAYEKVVLDRTPERRERQADRFGRSIGFAADFHLEPILFHGEMKVERSRASGSRSKLVLAQEVRDSRRALVFDGGTAPDNR